MFAQTTSTEVLGTTTTPSAGDYSFPLIEVDEYTVTQEALGFHAAFRQAEQHWVCVQ